MIRYLLEQAFSLLLTLALVLTLVFVALRLLPGDAASVRAGLDASSSQIAALRRSLGLDAPLYVQYGRYWQDLLRGDLGSSLRERRPVIEIVLERLPVTLLLASSAFLLSLFLGVGLGLLAGLRPGSRAERFVLGFTTLGLTVPEFWLAFLLLLLFAVNLGWLPLLGYPEEAGLGRKLYHLVLPAVTLALPRAAQLARLSRAQLLEERAADYLRTAQAKGLLPRQQHRHLAANALPKLLPLLALELGGLLTGAIIVEQVFALPGLGLALLGALGARDYPVVQGVTILAVLVFVGVNWLADLLQTLADPRLRYP